VLHPAEDRELVREVRGPGTVPDVSRQMQRAQGDGIVFETIHRRKDGTSFARSERRRP
jgi:hypothetical protein